MNGSRDAIAAALSTIDGITGYVRRPVDLTRGVAYPLVAEFVRGPGLQFGCNWRVIVILGPDEEEAEELMDALLPDVALALQRLMHVQLATPLAITTEAGQVFAAEIRGLGD
jgi:hypothetical protein